MVRLYGGGTVTGDENERHAPRQVWTQQALADYFGVSKRRIQQLEARVLRKLRDELEKWQ